MQVVHTFLCFHSLLWLFGAVWLSVCMQFACPRALWFLIYRQTSGQRGRQGPRHCGRHVSATEAPAFTVNARESEAIMVISFFSQFFHLLFHSQSAFLSRCPAVPLSFSLPNTARAELHLIQWPALLLLAYVQWPTAARYHHYYDQH